ncbi:Thioredoxin-like protein AAED1 [Escovopsis weberi]|uniref:Thioredoxin-like protein AAED1 n=1 Tax=Escovopsis weberi TaxID=150374 RepID=A0A0M8N9E4_ESCWE|nr:Thioredoxin-like protein AAED1 [Escovopsis weberi]
MSDSSKRSLYRSPSQQRQRQRASLPAPARPDSPAKSGSRSPRPASLSIDKTRPQDFDGELQTTDEVPSAEQLRAVEDYVLLDGSGRSHAFRSLYSGQNVARRVLVVFVRHFFCGMCQDYIRSLSESITPEALLRLPISTFIAVVGCGDPGLIDMYREATGCPFPIYTDPTRSLFDALGMVKTLSLGERPAYAQKSTARGVLDSVVQALRFVPAGLAHKSGDARQVGGEFLFEPRDVATPITSPVEPALAPAAHAFAAVRDGAGKTGGDAGAGAAAEGAGPEEKTVTWCHRMRTTRDHAEIPELMEILGLDGQGKPVQDERRWAEALEKRKGVGSSLAGAMNQMSEMRAAETTAEEGPH